MMPGIFKLARIHSVSALPQCRRERAVGNASGDVAERPRNALIHDSVLLGPAAVRAQSSVSKTSPKATEVV